MNKLLLTLLASLLVTGAAWAEWVQLGEIENTTANKSVSSFCR